MRCYNSTTNHVTESLHFIRQKQFFIVSRQVVRKVTKSIFQNLPDVDEVVEISSYSFCLGFRRILRLKKYKMSLIILTDTCVCIRSENDTAMIMYIFIQNYLDSTLTTGASCEIMGRIKFLIDVEIFENFQLFILILFFLKLFQRH